MNLETQFNIASVHSQIDEMSPEQLREFAKLTYKHMKEREAFFLPYVRQAMIGEW